MRRRGHLGLFAQFAGYIQSNQRSDTREVLKLRYAPELSSEDLRARLQTRLESGHEFSSIPLSPPNTIDTFANHQFYD